MKGIHNYANWHYLDTYWYGRCVSLQTNNSIKTINLKLQVESKIFIHTPGMLLEGDGGQRIQERYIKQGETNGLYLDYEYHQLLDVDYYFIYSIKVYQLTFFPIFNLLCRNQPPVKFDGIKIFP